jgi:hypothetical protein
VVAVTGDDEDNIICQMARALRRRRDRAVNDHATSPLRLTGSRRPSATSIISRDRARNAEHGLIHLLELRKENLEIVSATRADSPSVEAGVAYPAAYRVAADHGHADGQAQMAEGEIKLGP